MLNYKDIPPKKVRNGRNRTINQFKWKVHPLSEKTKHRMIKILKVEDARGKQTSKHQRHNIARRRNRYARAFPPETRQPDRAPIVLFTTFLRWRRYWQFGVFEIHKDDKSNGSCVPPSPFLSLSLTLRVSRVPHCLPSARVFIVSHVASSWKKDRFYVASGSPHTELHRKNHFRNRSTR